MASSMSLSLFDTLVLVHTFTTNEFVSAGQPIPQVLLKEWRSALLRDPCSFSMGVCAAQSYYNVLNFDIARSKYATLAV